MDTTPPEDQRRTEEAHKVSAERYRSLFEFSNDAVFIHDGGRNFLDVNARACEMLGYSREKLLTLATLELHPEGMAESAREAFRTLRTQGSVRFESQFIRSDGTIIDVEISTRPVGGEIDVYQGIARDITRRKQVEKSLRLNEARLESLLRISQYHTERIEDLLDLALEEATTLTGSKVGYIYRYSDLSRQFELNSWSRSVMDVCTIQEKQTVYDLGKTGIWGEAVRQRRPIVVNDFHAPDPLKKGYPEGHAPLFRFMTIPVFRGDAIVAVVGVANKEADYDSADVRQLTLMMDSVWNLVERKQVDLSLQESEDRYRRLFDSGNDAVFVHSFLENGEPDHFIEVNAIACKRYGYSREEFLKLSPGDIDNPAYSAAVMPAILPEFMEKKHILFEMVHRAKDGRPLPCEINAHLFDLRGNPTVLSVARDISDRKELQEKIDRLRRENEAFMRHEFKNLLIPMRGYSELLLLIEGDNLTTKQRNYLSIIKENADRAVHVVDDLKKLQDIEAGNYSLECTAVSVGDMVEDVLRNVTPEADRYGVSLLLNRMEKISRVNADMNLMPGVFSNLVMNAIEHVADIPKPSDRIVSIELFNREGKVCTRIQNGGKPMPPEKLATFFDKFNSDRKRKQNGTGLGTTYAWLVTRAHGGDIRVESNAREGTTVTVSFDTIPSRQ